VTPGGFRRRVEHVDTDAAGVVHFSRHLSLMETAVLDALEERGVGLSDLEVHGTGLAVVQVTARYRQAARYRDIVAGAVTIEHVGAASFRAAVTLTRPGPGAVHTELTTGVLTFAAVAADGSPTALPLAARQKLKGFAENGTDDVRVAADARQPL
jgi:acyl-CoA thioester hydrolase